VSIKGRGAADNPQGRFETLARSREPEAEVRSTPETIVTLHQARSIIARNDSPDLPFTQSINPYQGCEHGCIYCYARPSHAYLGLSPGLEFETRLFAKENAAELLRKELSRPGYRCELIALGRIPIPYQPIEREHRITRGVLEVLWEFRTQSGLSQRLADRTRSRPARAHGARRPVQVFVSIGSLDGEIARTWSRAPRRLPARRDDPPFERVGRAVRTLVAPIIPFLNDKDMEAVLEAVSEAGARMAGYTAVRLPWEVKDLFKDWLERNYPLKAKHVMARIHDMRGGATTTRTSAAA